MQPAPSERVTALKAYMAQHDISVAELAATWRTEPWVINGILDHRYEAYPTAARAIAAWVGLPLRTPREGRR